MSSGIGFHVKQKLFDSNSFEDDDIFEDDEEFDGQGYLYEVPYTSSSVDRSSIGSIPWADDAIKINKMEWDKVENMFSGLEPLSFEEDGLSNEILDWQKKFPQLLKKSNHDSKNLKSESLDVESLQSLCLTSDDEIGAEAKTTLTRNHTTIEQSTSKSSEDDSNLCQLMKNINLKSVPYKLSQRETTRPQINRRKCSSSTTSYSLRTPPTPIHQVPLATTSTNRFRMPPLFNVLDSTKKFRNLVQNKNQSFVQLTQIQQAKSAAMSQEPKSRPRFQTGHRSAWHVPFAANRFSQNRNSITLPSISNTHQVNKRYTTQPTNTSSNSEIATSDTTSSSSRRKANLLGFSSNISTQTNTSNLTTSGRSISAAVQYPRFTTFNALYLPYSASKFHPFK